MERIQILISKLKEQSEQNASPSQMLVTLQMIQTELFHSMAGGHQTLGTSKVSVMLPKMMNMPAEEMPEKKTVRAERQACSSF